MSKSTVLVVDDDSTNLNIISNILTNKYHVKVASNATTALKVLENFTVDIILLDVVMPNVNGYELAKQIKKIEKLKHKPFIFLTSKTDEESISFAFDLGASDYITKPVKPKELLHRVSLHLKMNKLQYKLINKINVINEKNSLILKQERLSAIAEMLDAVAHQWIQPISVMTLQAEIINMEFKQGILTHDEADKILAEIRNQSNHLVKTLQEFRGFFRPTDDIVAFKANDMIKRVLTLVQVELIKENIKVINNLDDSLILNANIYEIKHIFINFINNSKFAFNDNDIEDKKINISGYEDNKNIYIYYEDNAGGIKETILKDIFKSNVSGRENLGGTGTGLYMSKVIAEKYNGDIIAENKNDGAFFTLILPK